MKKDPNKCCVMFDEKLLWALVHDMIIHPLMAITLYKVEMFIKLHDYTSQRAWKRNDKNI